MSKVLFILKYRENPDGTYSHGGLSSGLLNSARYVCQMLNENGIVAEIEHAIDNNCIDRLVTEHKPTHVIIEAFWVVPDKFQILTKLHPNIKWIIRNHSELPFLASEGIAINWMCQYVKYNNVIIAGNSPRVFSEMKAMIKHTYPTWTDKEIAEKVWLLQNYYFFDIKPRTKALPEIDNIVNVGCFGAIRPLKNQLLQAVASIKFADSQNKTLYFHINSTRLESGSTINELKNLRALFAHVGNNGHKLIEHSWLDHDKFVEMLRDTIDIGVCVSHSETFCIVAADLVSAGVPLVVSKEVVWAVGISKADPNSSDDICKHMILAWKDRNLKFLSGLTTRGLQNFCKSTIKNWLSYLK